MPLRKIEKKIFFFEIAAFLSYKPFDLGERWPSSNITWSLRRPPPNLKVNDLRRELAAALKMWR